MCKFRIIISKYKLMNKIAVFCGSGKGFNEIYATQVKLVDEYLANQLTTKDQ